MGAPSSSIWCCQGIPLDNTYRNTLYWESGAAQRDYFHSKVAKEFLNYNYIKKTNSVKVEASIEEASRWNYLFYRYNGAYHYCFIVDSVYVNDNTTELFLELDVMQTHFYGYRLKHCFVERTHVTNDAIGANTVDEGLELGEMIDAMEYNLTYLNELCILVLASINPNHYTTAKPVQALAGSYNGVYSGLKVWAVNPYQFANFTTILEGLNEAGFLDGIVSMWMYPKALVRLGGEAVWDDGDVCKPVQECSSNMIWSIPGFYDSANKVHYMHRVIGDEVEFFIPKNNKLLSYPYSFLYMTNNQGDSAVYRYERFMDWSRPEAPYTPTFRAFGGISPESGVKLVPVNYNSREDNFDAGLSLGSYPTCAWDSDIYKMWLAQNQHQQTAATASAGIQAIAGGAVGVASLFTGNIAGLAAGAATTFNGLNQINQLVAQKRDMSIQPPQARGHFASSVNVSAGKQTFTVIRKCVSVEMGRIIDDYFTMFGYKINRIMLPSRRNRENFTYVKTIGCTVTPVNITGQEATKIQGIFDNGITFWTNPENVGDYSVSNNP